MIAMSLSSIAKLLNGQLIGQDRIISMISTDSRKLNKNEVFLALTGANFDGHNYVKQAVENECSAIIVQHHCDTDIAQVIVDNTHQALGEIAAYVKAQIMPKTIAITGSSGKTTVKEMVACILRRLGNVLATEGNFNNDIGVPLTLLRLEAHHDFAVLELGANHLGEIAYTTKLVKPDVALINNIAAAHLQGFGDLKGVARAKGEIYQGLRENGVAIYEKDSPWAPYWQNVLADKTMRHFSHDAIADCYSEKIEFDNQGCANFILHVNQQSSPVQLKTPGEHNVKNALAAASIASSMGASIKDIVAGLMQFSCVQGRVNHYQLNENLTLIDDSYNANVDSVKAAIALLAKYQGVKVLVLGDMAELGELAKEYHQAIGHFTLKNNIDMLFTIGELTLFTHQKFNDEGNNLAIHSEDKMQLFLNLKEILAQTVNPMTILVKGSRSAAMDVIVTKIIDWQKQQKAQESA